jgi:hypothetical protein
MIYFMKKIFIILLCLLITSCSYKISKEQEEDNRKLAFVNNVLNNPDSLLVYIKEAKFNADFYLKYEADDRDKMIKTLKSIKKDGWYIMCSFKSYSHDSKGNKTNFIHEIKIYPEKDNFDREILIFEWHLKNDEWVLCSIRMDPDHGCS